MISAMRIAVLVFVLGAFGALGTTTPGRQAVQPWPLKTEPLESPAGADSAQPQMTVSKRGVLLSWIEREGPKASLKFAERTPAGWTPARVAATGTDWFVNWADVPSVLRLDDGTLVAHWLQKSGTGTYAYDVRLSRSADDGRTWTPSIVPHGDGTLTEHGFASLFQMPGAAGGLGLVWLDGRAMKAGHGEHGGGDMALRFASFDRQWRQGPELLVDARVCECCPTTAVVTADGPLVAYRDRSAGEIRDIYVARLEQGKWTTPVAAHADDWQFNACPVNGPALAANGRNVALAWFTGKDAAVPQAFLAFSSDAGRTFGAPVRLGETSSLGRVDIELLPDGSAAALYIEHTGGKPRLQLRRIDRSGARSAPITIADIEDGRTSGYSRMARYGDELVFAWIERAGTLRVRTAAAKIPR